jgi:ribonucleoside-diphosphate reductase alpha chain
MEDERLLGVSMTGIFDNPLTYGKDGLGRLAARLESLKKHARVVNAEWADMLGINHSAAITCVKPSGTVSCLVDCASGIHPRYSRYYLRRVRIDKKDPLYRCMLDQGLPCEDCVMNPDSTAVFSFPMKAPDGAVIGDDITAIRHLEIWKVYSEHWAEHNPSITVNYTDDEFLEVGQWVYQNWDSVVGLSFLPKTDHVYAQAPFEAITKEMYDAFPKIDIDFTRLADYELEDTTTSSHTMACVGGSCELVDVTSS